MRVLKFTPMRIELRRDDYGNVTAQYTHDVDIQWYDLPLDWSDVVDVKSLFRRCDEEDELAKKGGRT